MSPIDGLDPVDDFAQKADSDEVIVMLTLQFKPGSADKVLAEMVPSVHLTRAEPGNNEFQFFKVSNSDECDVVPPVCEPASPEVVDERAAEVSDMRVGLNGRPAHVHADPPARADTKSRMARTRLS